MKTLLKILKMDLGEKQFRVSILSQEILKYTRLKLEASVVQLQLRAQLYGLGYPRQPFP